MLSTPQALASVLACLTLALVAARAGSATTAPAAASAPATGFVEKFEIPERDENGNLKWKLRGDRAQLHANGLTELFRVHAEFYESNQVQMVFTTSACTLNQPEKRAATDALVHLQRDNVVITGQGADWSGDAHSFHVRSNVVVVIGGPAAPPTEQP